MPQNYAHCVDRCAPCGHTQAISAHLGENMPTVKPRTTVTLEKPTHEVIQRLADLQGRSRGSVIADLLESVAPSLTRSVALLEAAFAAPDQIKTGLRAVIDSAHQELLEVSGEQQKKLDQMLLELSSSDFPGSVDPHVVTRGSGTQPPAPAKPSKRSSSRSKSRD